MRNQFSSPPKTLFGIVRRMKHSSMAFHVIRPRNRFRGRMQGPQVGPAHMTVAEAMDWLKEYSESKW